MGVEFTLRDRIEERSHFIFFSINLKFDATIEQISHPASDIEAFRDKSHRPAEANTLNIALVKYLERYHPWF